MLSSPSAARRPCEASSSPTDTTAPPAPTQALHDPILNEDAPWFTKIFQERIHLIPRSPDPSESSSSRSTALSSTVTSSSSSSSRRRSKPSRRKTVLYSQVGPSQKELITPSFRTSSLDLSRPAGQLRTNLSPAFGSGPPLSLTELISSRDEDEDEDEGDDECSEIDHFQRPPGLTRPSLQKTDGQDADASPGGEVATNDKRREYEWYAQDVVEPVTYRRCRCYSSPTAAHSPKPPLSSFTAIWR
jgi:hypothetical protein